MSVKSCLKLLRPKNLKRQNRVTFEESVICKQSSEPLKPKLMRPESYSSYNLSTAKTQGDVLLEPHNSNLQCDTAAAQGAPEFTSSKYESSQYSQEYVIQTLPKYVNQKQESQVPYLPSDISAAETLIKLILEKQARSQSNVAATATETVLRCTAETHNSYQRGGPCAAGALAACTLARRESHAQDEAFASASAPKAFPKHAPAQQHAYKKPCSTYVPENPLQSKVMTIIGSTTTAEAPSNPTLVKFGLCSLIKTETVVPTMPKLWNCESYPQYRAEAETPAKPALLKCESYPPYGTVAETPAKPVLLKSESYPRSQNSQERKSRILKLVSESVVKRAGPVSTVSWQTETGSRAKHTPAFRSGPPLSCNYCWNTEDHYNGGIRRRKTHYHCPDCAKNLCIVPCFHKYHKTDEETPDQESK